jgi:hypothetical protein
MAELDAALAAHDETTFEERCAVLMERRDALPHGSRARASYEEMLWMLGHERRRIFG